MTNKLVKVELGCGKTKTPGFIGIDRFPFDGVDIVADLNEGIPLEDDSVDLIYASHSLEHLNDLVFIMKEIYRVCKHKAIVCIVAPYYNTYLNVSNPYHKQVFNEHTFRFFTNSDFSVINEEEYYFPNSNFWGLGNSDNSKLEMDFRCINMEFFYFPEYELLDEDEKRRLRQTKANVCDQIMYHLLVVKKPISDEEVIKISNSPLFEPDYITRRKIRTTIRKLERDKKLLEEALNKRTNECNKLYDEKVKLEKELVAITSEKEKIKQAKYKMHEELEKLKNEKEKLKEERIQLKVFLSAEKDIRRNLEREKVELQQELVKKERKNDILREQNMKLERELQMIKNEKKWLEEEKIRLEKELEIIKYEKEVYYNEKTRFLQKLEENKKIIDNLMIENERSRLQLNNILYTLKRWGRHFRNITNTRGYIILQKLKRILEYNDIIKDIADKEFITSVILKSKLDLSTYKMKFSDFIPNDRYFEYEVFIDEKAEVLKFYILNFVQSRLFVEIVNNDRIVYQNILQLDNDGVVSINVQNISGDSFIRFKTLNEEDIICVLEWYKRKSLLKFFKEDIKLVYY
ncbi:methyltransferase domain-containing protein [Caloranaerobacter azorensis]|uniref:Methyltransferase domain-containing protein n=1 Tax=Caloranaerobacter azorensis TaxID=116090 RepID=A0A6P1YDY8_9FIRM|nr:methyltransferase domain-containing protein [Caloranaerobacter azorensis]QIB27579.1 methyltransferase domain-containing protein [Caloranaerobacter azorensis]